MIFRCNFCGRETTNAGANKKHENSCKSNPNWRPAKGGQRKGSTPWNKGKKLHYTVDTKGKPGTFTGRKHTDETKQKMSDSKKKLYESGWECVAGRCPKYKHNSPVAGEISVDGSWELKFCEFADRKGLTWKRNLDRFPYVRPDGKSATYQPDFYVDELDAYIEIKGYETDLDQAKWKEFPHKLIVIRRNEIGRLDEWFKSAVC